MATDDPEREPLESMPRWVKVSGIITLVVVLAFVVLLLSGRGGEHGPGRHSLPTAGTSQPG